LQEELTKVHRTKGENAEQMLSISNCLQSKDKEIADLNNV